MRPGVAIFDVMAAHDAKNRAVTGTKNAARRGFLDGVGDSGMGVVFIFIELLALQGGFGKTQHKIRPPYVQRKTTVFSSRACFGSAANGKKGGMSC